MRKLHTIDRISATLDSQLLSSVTVGSFTLSGAAPLGAQTIDSPSGEYVILTLENEQILGTMTYSAGTITFTITTRGYNSTTAATHAASTVGYFRMTSDHYEKLKDELASHVNGLILYDGTVPTVTSATVLTVPSSDETARFTVGRIILYKIVSTWYRAIVRSSSFSTDTTINISGNGLPASGTILSIGFEMTPSINAARDLMLLKEISASPAENPPAGYDWLYFLAGVLTSKDPSGNVSSYGAVNPPGVIAPYGGMTAPTGWLLCDGSAVSRSTYAALFAILTPTLGTFTVTIASPGVVTLSSHGLATGDSVFLTTTGALPTGLSINTRYWVIKNDANSFWLATSLANALAGTKINTSGSQSGTHTAKLCPYGVGDGTTTFNLPSLKGLVPVGKDATQTEFAGLGQTGGEKTHVLTAAEMAAHTHQTQRYTSGAGGTSIGGASESGGAPTAIGPVTTSAGSDTAHNNIQPYLTLNYIIKT